jgi:Protein of unknown function (DUF4241)
MNVARSVVLLAALFIAATQPAYADLNAAAVYSEGQDFVRDVGGRQVHLTTHQQPADDLVLTSGSIVAGDAIVIFNAQLLGRSVEPDRYPVTATLTTDDQNDVRVAYARVDFSTAEVVRWEPVVTYPITSGTAMFMDADADSAARADFNTYGNAVLGALTYAVDHNEYWTSVVLNRETAVNSVVFTSGYGDGNYTVYWGFDANDAPVALVADFNVIP